ncbi:MAG: hypothetical protein KDD99_22305 [Bacteroidetes bacterium]|nr:hypothetical protein [Bacteroidota bacterium]
MNEDMITLAFYSEVADANRHASLLKAEGIRCEVVFNNPISGDALHGEREGEIEIKVHPDDFDRADMILELDDQARGISQKPTERAGAANKLTGGILGMVGFLTALGNIPDDLIMLPYAIVAIGRLFYVRGIAQAQVEDERE